ncbi:MAG: hypothetical protein KAF27_01865 [Porphyrobacter sp.]|nr:hypothetical protein [Porphyrobacter sp.]
MTAILNLASAKPCARAGRLLLIGASGLALNAPLAANELLFTTNEARPETGQRIDQRGGLTQIALTGGGLVSIVDAAEYRINADGSVDLYEGTITVAAASAGEVVVRMPEGVEGRVTGAGAAGNFAVRDNGEASGHALTGTVRIGRAGALERFAAGEMWRVAGRSGRVRQVIANAAQAQPGAGDEGAEVAALVLPIGEGAGPVAAVLNGLPLGFGDQLAAAGASSDILAAARRIEAVAGNPALDTFPSGDFALLVSAAAQLEGAYGGTPFPAAQADIIRAYLRFLGGGGAGSAFLASYSRFAIDYIDLIRSGGLPSAFAGAGPQDVEAYLAYIRRTGAFGGLAARDRVLAEAYLAFLGSGGNRDAFARSFTDLTIAYFSFVRGGGDPAAFAGASQATLAQTIAFLRDSGMVVQLGTADRALVEAFLANGGLAFAGQYRVVLGDYFAFLASGRRPSEYAALDQATLRSHLETLASTGLLTTVLGERAGFYTDYLAFLRAGGTVDGFGRLPFNIFTGYTAKLDAYFAFLSTGRRPSEFTEADIATLQAWLLEMQAAGALERFLGNRAAFFADYAAFVAAGGGFDAFARLPFNIFTGYASRLDGYFAFLATGRRPSEFTETDTATLQAWLLELQAAGALDRFLGDRAAFFAEFAAFVAAGGNFDAFARLPFNIFTGYAAQLDAYFTFLAGGRLPSEFTAVDLATLQAWLLELTAAGALERFLGGRAAFFAEYAAFVAGGGSFDAFARLPAVIFAGYANDLRAFFDFLLAGGVPSGYTLLTPDQIRDYLAALEAAGATGRFLGDLAAFWRDYAVYLAGGGNPDLFAGLPGSGGTGGGNPPALATQFSGAVFLASFGGGSDTLTQATISVSEDGRITNAQVNGTTFAVAGQPGGAYDQRGWEVTAAGRFGDAVAFTSYLDRNGTQGSNFVINMVAGVPARVLPQTGLVSYRLVGGAAPTERGLAPGTEGYFTGNLAVAFGGAAPRVGLDFEVSSNGTTFATGTAGGAADPLNGGMSVDGNGRFRGFFAARATAGTACTRANACASSVEGGLFGDQGAYAGLVWFLNDASDVNAIRFISGSAVFGTSGTALAGLGTAPPPPPPPPPPAFSGTVTGLTVVSSRPGQPATSIASWSNATAMFDANGRISGYTNNLGAGSGLGALADASTEAGSIAGAVAWARFLDPPNAQGDVARTGIHTVLGIPATNLPTAGTVTYNLIGGTRPTTNTGTVDPGSFSGALAVDFATRRVGIDFNVAISDRAWRIATAGGAANPGNGGMQIGADGRSFFGSPAVTGLNAASCTAGCTSDVLGTFFGAGASHTGVVYRVLDGSFLARGLGVFAAPGAAGTPVERIGTPPATGGGGGGGAAAVDRVVPTGGPNSLFAFAGSGSVGEAGSAATMTVTDGVLRQARRGSVRVEYTPTAQSVVEVSGDQGVIGWQRINSVNTVYSGGTGQVFQAQPFAQQYWHTIWGAPAVNLPTSGLVNYELIGGSTAHQTNARAGDGIFQGRFSVDFATLRAGLEATVTLDGPDAAIFDFASAGGVAAPSMQLRDDGFGARRFNEVLATTQRGVGTVSRGTTVGGFIAGIGATHAGLTYGIRTASNNTIIGTAAFRATTGSTGAAATGQIAASATGAGGSALAVTPPAPGYDWSRWNGSSGSGTGGSGIASLRSTDGLDPLVTGPATAVSADSADRRAAIQQAERLMGGMITFGAAPVPEP